VLSHVSNVLNLITFSTCNEFNQFSCTEDPYCKYPVTTWRRSPHIFSLFDCTLCDYTFKKISHCIIIPIIYFTMKQCFTTDMQKKAARKSGDAKSFSRLLSRWLFDRHVFPTAWFPCFRLRTS